MLTKKQHQLLQYIHERLERNGISPSFEEMKNALELKSKSGVHRLVNALEERGFIRRLPNRARALEVVKLPEGMRKTPAELRETDNLRSNANVSRIEKSQSRSRTDRPNINYNDQQAANDIVELPLHGRIAAGVPIEAFEDYDKLSVPAALLGHGEHYALEIAGDSMIEAGILDGDYALIQKTEQARNGEIVVALIHNEEATLKYLHKIGSKIRLDPANASHAPQTYEASDVQIQGRLSGLLRRYL